MFVPHMKHIRASAACYWNSFTFLYVNNIHTSQETHMWAFTVCYGDSFTFCMDIVRTSHEVHLWASTVCYGNSFTILVYVDNNVRTSQETPVVNYGLLQK
jgi:hypothetical protein